MVNTKEFLDNYRELETELGDKSVLDYENKLDGSEKEKLKVCRIMRNYLSHNDTTFIEPSKNQVKFIKDLALNIRRQSNIVKKEMKKVPILPTKKTNLKDLIPLLAKNDYVILDCMFVYTRELYFKQLAKGLKKVEVPSKLPKLNYTNVDEKISNLSNELYIVSSDGTDKGKYLGVIDLR